MKASLVVAAALVLTILWSGSLRAGKKGRQKAARSYEILRVIDAHAHFDFQTDPDRGPLSEKDLIQPSAKMEAEYREAHVVGAVVHGPKGWLKPFQIRPDSSVHFVTCAGLNLQSQVKEVEAALVTGKWQCLKIYLGYVPRFADDPFYEPFLALAEKRGVPVVFHTGDTEDKMAEVRFADPLPIDRVAVTHPRLTIVIAHMGNPWIQSAAEVAYKNDNVYVDLSALKIGELGEISSESNEELIVKPVRWFRLYVENPAKLMFGTDYPLVHVRPYLEAVKRAIPRDQWDNVFYRNAARVFRFPGAPR